MRKVNLKSSFQSYLSDGNMATSSNLSNYGYGKLNNSLDGLKSSVASFQSSEMGLRKLEKHKKILKERIKNILNRECNMGFFELIRIPNVKAIFVSSWLIYLQYQLLTEWFIRRSQEYNFMSRSSAKFISSIF